MKFMITLRRLKIFFTKLYKNDTVSLFVWTLKIIFLPVLILRRMRRKIITNKGRIKLFNAKETDQPEVLIILLDINLNVGSDKSILNYAEALSETHKKVRIETGQKISPTGIKLLKNRPENMIIIVNGLKSFIKDKRLSEIGIHKNNWFIYLHECKVIYQNNIFNRDQALHEKLLLLFPRHNLLTVSEQQSQFYSTMFQIKQTNIKTIYNFIKPTENNITSNANKEFPNTLRYHHQLKQYENLDFDPQKTHIIMVGSCQPRKGVSFFSKVAEESLRQGKPWQFHWVGVESRIPPNLYFSKYVNWISRKPSNEVQEILQQSDIFFLSSISESFPLTICEALFKKKPCIAFKDGIGAYEELKNFKEVIFYDHYVVDHAIKAIERSLTLESFDETEELLKHLEKLLSPEEFIVRMDNIIGINS